MKKISAREVRRGRSASTLWGRACTRRERVELSWGLLKRSDNAIVRLATLPLTFAERKRGCAFGEGALGCVTSRASSLPQGWCPDLSLRGVARRARRSDSSQMDRHGWLHQPRDDRPNQDTIPTRGIWKSRLQFTPRDHCGSAPNRTGQRKRRPGKGRLEGGERDGA